MLFILERFTFLDKWQDIKNIAIYFYFRQNFVLKILYMYFINIYFFHKFTSLPSLCILLMIKTEEEILMLSNSCPWNSLLLGDSVLCLNIGLNDFSRLLKPKLMSKPRNTLKSLSNELSFYWSPLWGLREANNEIAEDVIHHPQLSVSHMKFKVLLTVHRPQSPYLHHMKLKALWMTHSKILNEFGHGDWSDVVTCLCMEPRQDK